MNGRRIPVPESGDIFSAVEQPGDYCGPAEGTIPGAKKPDGSYEQIPVRRVAFILPIRKVTGGHYGVHHCQEPPHKFAENPDGTLTITASILAKDGPGNNEREIWHGYLTNGQWISA